MIHHTFSQESLLKTILYAICNTISFWYPNFTVPLVQFYRRKHVYVKFIYLYIRQMYCLLEFLKIILKEISVYQICFNYICIIFWICINLQVLVNLLIYLNYHNNGITYFYYTILVLITTKIYFWLFIIVRK